MPSNPERADRCLRLVEYTQGTRLRGTDQCPNPRLPGADECAHHLGQTVADFRRLTESERDAA